MVIVSLVAGATNYFIGRWWMKDSSLEKFDQITKNEATWKSAIRDLAQEAGYGLHMLIRFAPIPSMLVNYAMGALQARFAPFIFAATVGVLPQFLWVHGGAMATTESSSPWRWISGLISVAAAVSVAVIIPQMVADRLKRELR